MAKPKISVLHILNSLGLGGTERRVLRLKLGLDPERYDVRLLTLRPPPVGGVLGWPGADHIYFPIAPGLHWDRLWALAQEIRQGQIDIVHTHNWGTMLYGVLAARLARVPTILHGEHGRNDTDRTGVSCKREMIAGGLARLATKIVAVNEFVATDVQTRWKMPSRYIECIPNGVDLGRFSGNLEKHDRGDVFVVGTITRFDSIKNLPCLIRAFELFHATHPQIRKRLVLVGTGPDLDSVHYQAQQGSAAGLIDFVGETRAPEDWYPRFDIFVNTSFSEGMSNSLLEAMASGLPIVASAIAGNLCWLQPDINALFFPSGDNVALAELFARSAQDLTLRQRLGAANRKLVQEKYDNNCFLHNYDNLYRRLLDR